MLYPVKNVNKLIYRIEWVTQRNIEAEEKWALKKEELEKEIRILRNWPLVCGNANNYLKKDFYGIRPGKKIWVFNEYAPGQKE